LENRGPTHIGPGSDAAGSAVAARITAPGSRQDYTVLFGGAIQLAGEVKARGPSGGGCARIGWRSSRERGISGLSRPHAGDMDVARTRVALYWSGWDCVWIRRTLEGYYNQRAILLLIRCE